MEITKSPTASFEFFPGDTVPPDHVNHVAAGTQLFNQFTLSLRLQAYELGVPGVAVPERPIQVQDES